MKTLKVPSIKNSAESGFTIIELIVVILLLGILTATALPRFLDVTDEAHDAVFDAVFGGLNTGRSLFRAGFIAQGQPASGTAIASFGDGTLRTHANGYPLGTAAGVGQTLDAHSECTEVFNSLLQQGRPSIVGSTTTGIAPTSISGGADIQAIIDSSTDNVCYYAYTGQYSTTAAVTAVGDDIPVIVYNASTGSITTTTGSAL